VGEKDKLVLGDTNVLDGPVDEELSAGTGIGRGDTFQSQSRRMHRIAQSPSFFCQKKSETSL
jgi:hypothetical protein